MRVGLEKRIMHRPNTSMSQIDRGSTEVVARYVLFTPAAFTLVVLPDITPWGRQGWRIVLNPMPHCRTPEPKTPFCSNPGLY